MRGCQLAAEVAAHERQLADDVMAQCAAASAFAAAATAASKPEVEADTLLDLCCGDGFGSGQVIVCLHNMRLVDQDSALALP